MKKLCLVCKKQFPAWRDSQKFCSYRCRGLWSCRKTHPDLNEQYFSAIDTKEKAYWIGFCFADAAMVRIGKDGLQFRLALSKADEDHLDRFIRTIGANRTKKAYLRNNGNGLAAIQIRNRIFCENLMKQGCIPKKSKRLVYPKLRSTSLEKAFLLGFFDGDGTVGRNGGAPVITSCSANFLKHIRNRYDLKNVLQNHSTFHRLNIGTRLFHELLQNYSQSLARKRKDTFREKSSKYVGVTYHKRTGKWVSVLALGHGRVKHLGLFEDERKAHLVWKKARAMRECFKGKAGL